jgi:parallel beta-helix repeat protein
MTAPATTRRAGPFNGNGVTTTFPFTFKVFASSDIEVIKTSAEGLDTVLTLGAGYSVTLNADQDATPGGSITHPVSGAALAAGEKLTAVGALPYDQTADLPTGGNYRAVVIENALDRTVMQVQQLAEELGRALTLPASAATGDTALPAPQAGRLLGWNDAADALQNYDSQTLATIVAYGTANSDVFSGDGVTTFFTLSDNPGNINNLDIAIGGVTQTPIIDYTWSGGTTVVFTSAPPAGTNNILVRYMQGLPQSGAALPNQTGNANKFLRTDGSDPSWVALPDLRNVFEPYTYGAAGDGATDDTAAVNACLAAAAAANGTVVIPPGNFLVGGVNIPNGVRLIQGAGGRFSLANTANAGLRMLGTIPAGAAANVADLTVQGLYIDAKNNSQTMNPIWGQNCSGVRLLDNVIVNMSNGIGILLRIYEGVNSGGGNVVSRNKVFGDSCSDPNSDPWYAIDVGTSIVYDLIGAGPSKYTASHDNWKGVGLPPCNAARMTATGTAYHTGTIITENRISGGYYGISAVGLQQCVISNNSTQSNVRGISLQHCSSANLVAGNAVLENKSAGIHVAYGSSYNRIGNNRVYTTIGNIEALFQCYVGTKYNVFSANTGFSFDTTGPKHGLYCAVHCDHTLFEGNQIYGNFSRSGASVESAWKTTTADTYSYAVGGPTYINGMATTEVTYVMFRNNLLNITSAACVLHVGQHDGITLRRCRFEGNVSVNGAVPVFQLRAFAENGSPALGACVYTNNSFAPDATLDNFYSSIAAGHFYFNNGNTLLTNNRVGEYLTRISPVLTTRSANLTQPCVAFGSYFVASNSTNTSITDFVNGENGQEITVRLDVFTGITHNAGTLVLKGAANIAAGTRTANDIITFKRDSNAWFEVSRNW